MHRGLKPAGEFTPAPVCRIGGTVYTLALEPSGRNPLQVRFLCSAPMYEGYDVKRIGIHSESCPAWKHKECDCGLKKAETGRMQSDKPNKSNAIKPSG